MKALLGELRAAQLPAGTSSGTFLPYSALTEIVTKQVVTNTLARRKSRSQETISKIASFVCGKPEARRVFAILIYIGQVRLIELFYEHNFVDSILPLYIDASGTVRTWTNQKRNSDITRKVFSDDVWGEEVVPDIFCDAQWQFLGPIFSERQFSYTFLPEHRMPFLKQSGGHRESHFSTVGKWSIHRSHFKTSSKLRLSVDKDGHPIVAVKELKSVNMNDSEYKRAAETEADVLEMIREMEHAHLIKAIAFYTRADQYFIVFPWAGGGNLRDYWGREPPRKLDADFVGWVLGQICGLAGAIKKLHSAKDSTCRHGDLKPENILCFEDNKSSDPFAQPFLVIADVGLAKVHTLATEMRNEATRTLNGTVMYEPPEAVLLLTKNRPRSRRYDIWSIGCIYFEFLIWLLYGKAVLVRFGEDITHPVNRTRQFFDVTGSGVTGAAKIKTDVQKWMDWIRRDPRCPPNTAIRKVLELICTRLLVIEVNSSGSSSTQGSTTLHSANGPDNPSIIRSDTNSSFNGNVTSDLRYRATSIEMHETLAGILKDASGTKPKIAWMNWQARSPGGPGRYGDTLGVFQSGTGRPPRPMFFQLDNEWECSPDINTARELSNEVDISRPLPSTNTTANLCPQCKDLQQRLWSRSFSFSDNLEALANRVRVCDLCRLLCFSLEPMITKTYGEIHFEKFNSYLTSNLRPGRPVAVFYSLPEKPLLGAQMGMPMLPPAGSPAHIAVLSTWMRVCDDTHDCSPITDTTFLPTRVIDVGPESFETCRLLCADRGQTNPGKYLALSHRWGAPDQHRKFCTLKKNMESFKEEIKMTDLPQTFQDAIKVTRSLGIGYLWIDSLCIVQDDPEDWKMESRLMEQVYSSAYATLAASCASGTEDGFLKPRPWRHCVTLESGRGSYYVCDSIDDFGRDVDQGELNKRAWILQERALSRRTIYFSEKQTYWECGRGVRGETMTKMRNRKASFLGDSDFPHSIDTYVRGMKIELYQDLYQKYSGLALSSIGDRPVAIRGLETRLIRTFKTVGAHGVFDTFFHRCLLWQRAKRSLNRIDLELLRGVHVPSWSWMAYDGEIRYMNVPFNRYSWEADIISPFRGWSSQSMKERGEAEAVCEIKAPVWEFGDSNDLQLELDTPDRTLPNLKCVIVARGKDLQGKPQQSHYIIVVQFVANDGLYEVYERAGVAEVRGEQIAFHKGSRAGVLR
ncbi:HET-domain-containing protein [Colletotrichum asianum]